MCQLAGASGGTRLLWWALVQGLMTLADPQQGDTSADTRLMEHMYDFKRFQLVQDECSE